MIPGKDKNLFNLIGVFNKKSQPLEIFQNRKRRSVKGTYGALIMENCWSETVLKQSLELIKELGYWGFANPEFKLDPRDGKYKLMEINGRVTMTNSHSLACGIDLALALYEDSLSVASERKFNFKPEIVHPVIWWDVFGDIACAIRLVGSGGKLPEGFF